METTRWTQVEIQNQLGHCNTLGEFIKFLEIYYVKKDEVICEIKIDGQLLSESEEQRYKQNPISNFSEITVKSNNLNNLFDESLDSLIKILGEIEEELILSSDQFRVHNLTCGQEDFDLAIKKTQLAFDLNTYLIQLLCRFFESDLENQFKKNWQQIQKEFFQLSQQVYVTFQTKNYVLLSDLLEYEYSNVLQKWVNWLMSIKNHFKK